MGGTSREIHRAGHDPGIGPDYNRRNKEKEAQEAALAE
jgi:hypothetical protein